MINPRYPYTDLTDGIFGCHLVSVEVIIFSMRSFAYVTLSRLLNRADLVGCLFNGAGKFLCRVPEKAVSRGDVILRPRSVFGVQLQRTRIQTGVELHG